MTATRELRPTAVNTILAEVRAVQAGGRALVSLMRGEPDLPTPSHIVEAATRALADRRTGYPDNRGELRLREAVAAKLARDNGVAYDPGSEILVTTGATFGIYAALMSSLREGDEVLLPDPVYDAYQSPIVLAGGRARAVRAPIEQGRFVLTAEALEASVTPRTRMLVLNTPWNPVGTVFRESELRAIGEFVIRHDLLLVSDEIYETIVYQGHRHLSPSSLSSELRNRTILVNSLSKTYAMTGWRVGYCAAPAAVINAMFLVLQQSSRGPATFIQDAAAVALTSSQACVAAMRDEYASRRSIVLSRLAGLPRVPVLAPEGGFFAMVDARATGIPSNDLRRRLLNDYGVVVAHGSAYGEGGEGTLRVSFASGGDVLTRGLERLREGLAGTVSAGVNIEALRTELERQLEGEVRFDRVSRVLYSTDASVYQIEPIGVVVPRSREDLIRTVRTCIAFKCPMTMRGGGTSQAGQAIGAGVVIDTSKYLNRLVELNVEERWARVEPGIVLDEINASLRPQGLRFAPDISTASRATLGGMMANNSAGARSVYYGKTIDHVLEQEVMLSDGSIVHFGPVAPDDLDARCAGSTLEAACYTLVRRLASEQADEVRRRFPKVLRRVGGYNLDEFIDPERPFNLAKLMVGSEGTLGVVLEAKVNLVPLPAAKAVLAIQFADLLEALAATPLILKHRPSAVEVMDKFILDYTKQNAALDALRRSFIDGDPGALLCVEFYADDARDLPARLQQLEWDLRAHKLGYRYFHALDPGVQARVWSLREAALGLSMAMKDDAKSLSFVEDTAVEPEKLRNYIERFLALVRRHETTAGVYAHASVGCLHVRPVINLKTEEGVRKFEAVANDVADLVLEFGGALSGEHGDGMVRSPFMEKMFGPVLYQAFRTVKHTFDPDGLFNPGKIVDAGPLTANLRYGAGYQTPVPITFFDYSEYGGMGGAVEMCSGLGACRKKLEGTMCPSYMATKEEKHSTRGRANVLRLAMAGRLGEAGLGDEAVHEVLDLCLECRACKAECPVGVDMARFKSEFLADYYSRHGTPLSARMLGNARVLAEWGSRFAPLSNWIMGSGIVRRAAESIGGIDRHRALPRFERHTLARMAPPADEQCDVVLFNDTFTNYYEPDIGLAALEVLKAAGVRAGVGRHGCCGRPQISKGLLGQARELADASTRALHPYALAGKPILFCEPSCLSAMREDVPSLLRGGARLRAEEVARSCMLLEEYLESVGDRLPLKAKSGKVLLHGHCHQKAMGMVAPVKALLSRIPGAEVVDLDAGCCGMAGSFGYMRGHVEVSRAIGERKLLPAVRAKGAGDVVVAAGTSCRHQVSEFTGIEAVHPAVLLRSLL